jgi:hypothetical protein
MEAVTEDTEPPSGAAITTILNRYGDLFPRTGTVEIYADYARLSFCDYTFLRPGEWSLVFRAASDPRPPKNLRYMQTQD